MVCITDSSKDFTEDTRAKSWSPLETTPSPQEATNSDQAPPKESTSSDRNTSSWASVRHQKKDSQHYAGEQDRCRECISGNELLTVQSGLEAVAARTISLLTTNGKTLN